MFHVPNFLMSRNRWAVRGRHLGHFVFSLTTVALLYLLGLLFMLLKTVLKGTASLVGVFARRRKKADAMLACGQTALADEDRQIVREISADALVKLGESRKSAKILVDRAMNSLPQEKATVDNVVMQAFRQRSH